MNVTPDSFSDGGNWADPQRAADRVKELFEAGADIVDIGGESTRPGARAVGVEEEWDRVGGVLARLGDVVSGRCVSVDTQKAEIARRALECGASVINDVGGLRDAGMLTTVGGWECGYILMHMRGTPATMQAEPVYEDVVSEVREFLRRGLVRWEEAGLARERVCVDPGFGFGKSWDHNRALLLGLGRLKELGCAVMAGLSRKSFVGAVSETPARERLAGSLAAETLAVWHGADVIRTHEPAASRQAARLSHRVRGDLRL